MEMIWHYNELMQEILSLSAIVKQIFDEKPSHSLRLKNVPLLKCGGRDEVAAISSVAVAGSGHGMHLSGWKPPSVGYSIAALEALPHPKAAEVFQVLH
jgi:hypothetical protein